MQSSKKISKEAPGSTEHPVPVGIQAKKGSEQMKDKRELRKRCVRMSSFAFETGRRPPAQCL